MDNILAEKKNLRSTILKTRVEIPDEKIRQDSETIISKLMKLDSYQKSNTISCFIDFIEKK